MENGGAKMISSYKQLTGRYLKSNKKRSALTIIGIILSVALISSIGLFFKGIQVAEIDQAKNDYGAWHVMYKKVDSGLLSKVANNPKVSRYGFYTRGKEVQLSGKLSAFEEIATDKAIDLFPYRVKTGRLPQNENEVSIEKWALKYIDSNAKVGDKINFDNKQYTLVGILEDIIENQIDNKVMLLTKNNNVNKENSILLVEVSSKTKLGTAVTELKQLTSQDNVQENTSLLFAQGVSGNNDGLRGLLVTIGIIVGIVMVATIAVIYNSFQISVVERIKQFGLLRAVGTTPKQIRKIVLREASVLAAIAVPLGLLFGVVAIYGISFVFKLIGGDTVIPMRASVDFQILGISAVVGLISIYLSALIPAFFAGRISPLVAISSRTSITKEKIKRRKNRIVQKLFGFEGAMAAKNIKRNRKRYRITVFSIVISVVLFVTFKSFMDMSLTVTTAPNESKNMHFSIVRDNQATEQNLAIGDNVINNIKSLKSVDKVYKIYDPYFFDTAINPNKEVKEVQDIGNIYNRAKVSGNDKTIIESSMVIYDDSAMGAAKKYIESGNINVEDLNKENGIILIRKNRIFDQKTKKEYFGQIADLKVGDEIELQYKETSDQEKPKLEFGKGKVNKVKIMAIVDNEPFNFRGSSRGIKMITTEQVVKNISGKSEVKPVNLNVSIKDVKNEDAAKSEIEGVIKSDPSLELINNIDQNRRSKTSMLMVQILMYGFVVVVSLIGSVNIINTLTTNIILRKREFAALKSIGLTQKGLRKMIVLEGLLYGIMGTIYGSIIGCGLSYVIYGGINGVRGLGYKIPWDAVAIAGAAALIIGYLSVLSPLSRIKKENLIEAIREDF